MDLKKYFLSLGKVIDNIESYSLELATNSLMQSFSDFIRDFESNVLKKSDTLSSDDDIQLTLVVAPYLNEKDHKNKYTLVLDLDETLIHYQDVF